MVLEVETKMCPRANISLAEQIIWTKHQQVGTSYKLILTQGKHHQLAYFSSEPQHIIVSLCSWKEGNTLLFEARTCTGWPEPEAEVIPFWTWVRDAGVGTGSLSCLNWNRPPLQPVSFHQISIQVFEREGVSSPDGLVPGSVCCLSLWS